MLGTCQCNGDEHWFYILLSRYPILDLTFGFQHSILFLSFKARTIWKKKIQQFTCQDAYTMKKTFLQFDGYELAGFQI